MAKSFRRALRDAAFPEFTQGIGVKSSLSALTGLGPIAATLRRSASTVSDGASLIGSLGAAALSLVRGQEIDIRQGAGSPLAEGARKQFELWGMVAIATVTGAVLSYCQGASRVSLLLLAFVPGMLCLAAQASFVAFCARTRTLSLSRWLRSPGHWFPPALLALAIVAMTHPALADTVPGVASTQSVAATLAAASGAADIGASWLRAIVPDGGAASPLTQALSIGNVILMAVAAFLLPIFSLFAIKEAANTGKSHGGKWNGYYGPIKLAIGFGLLAPVLPNGLNSAEMAVMGLAGVSSRAGNLIWTAYSQGLAAGLPVNQSIVGAGPIPGAEVARRILRSETCVALLTQQQATAGWVANHFWWQPPVPPLPAVAGTATTSGDAYTWDYDICGAATVPTVPATSINGDELAFDAARRAAMGTLVSSVRASPLIATLVAASSPGGARWPQQLSPSFAAIGTAYEKAMNDAATAFAASKNAAFKATLTAGNAAGWIAAFDYFRTLSLMQSQQATLASTPPTWRDPRARLRDGRPAPGLRTDEAEVAMTLAKMDEQWSVEAGALSGTALAAPGDENADILTRVLAPLTKPLVEAAINAAGTNPTDPIGTMINQGQLVITGAEVGLGVATVAAVGTTNAVGSIFGAGGAFAFLSTPILLFIGWALALGIEHAFILPMLPFIYGFAAAVTWIITVCEALVGVSIVAVLFCRPDGEDLVGPVQKPGMMMLVSVMLRPALTICGFIFAMTLIGPLEGYLDSRFAGSFVGVTGGHLAGVSTILVGFTLMGYMRYQLWVRLAGLITLVPDRILSYIGERGAEALGASETATGTHGAAAAAAAGASAGLLRGGNGGGPTKDPSRKGGGAAPGADGGEVTP